MIKLNYNQRRWWHIFPFTKNNNQQIAIADRWADLSREEYISVVSLLHELTTGKSTLLRFRLRLLQVLTGYKRSKKRFNDDQAEIINNNLVILADMLTFPLIPNYQNPEYLEVLSPALQKKLKTTFPQEIYEAEYIYEIAMIAHKLECSISINLDFRCNPLPYINIDENMWYGPDFSVDKNRVVQTDMIALEFIDASEFAELYYATKDENYLDNLVSVLYRQKRENYSTHRSMRNAKYIKQLPYAEKFGVILFFQSVVYYLSTHPQYGILYRKPENNESGKAKIDLGSGDVIAQLTKDGFGTREEIENLPLGDYFTLLLKQIIDAVKNMRNAEIKEHEIAQRLGISIETVQKI